MFKLDSNFHRKLFNRIETTCAASSQTEMCWYLVYLDKLTDTPPRFHKKHISLYKVQVPLSLESDTLHDAADSYKWKIGHSSDLILLTATVQHVEIYQTSLRHIWVIQTSHLSNTITEHMIRVRWLVGTNKWDQHFTVSYNMNILPLQKT